MAKGEIKISCAVKMCPECEDKNADTYEERIKPTLMPLEKFFDEVMSREEYWCKAAETIAFDLDGTKVKAVSARFMN